MDRSRGKSEKQKAKTWRWNPCHGKLTYILRSLDASGFGGIYCWKDQLVGSVFGGLRAFCGRDDFTFKDLVSVLQVCSHLPGRQAEAGSVPEAEHWRHQEVRGDVQGHSRNESSEAGAEARSFDPGPRSIRECHANESWRDTGWRKCKTATRGRVWAGFVIPKDDFSFDLCLGDDFQNQPKRRNLVPDNCLSSHAQKCDPEGSRYHQGNEKKRTWSPCHLSLGAKAFLG